MKAGCCARQGMGQRGLLGRPHPAFGHPLPKGEGLDLGRNEATLSQKGRNQATLSQKGKGLDLRVRPFDNRQSGWVPFTDDG